MSEHDSRAWVLADRLRDMANGVMPLDPGVLKEAAGLLQSDRLPINRDDWDIIGNARFITDAEKRKLLRVDRIVEALGTGEGALNEQ